VNTVARARELHKKIATLWESTDDRRLVLLHSRVRPADRENAVRQALADPPPKGTIVVSTQVIEAGVDVSATTLFTELAPWAALVQRFGRCNRRGEDDGAQVFWVAFFAMRADAEKMAPPYEMTDLSTSAEQLRKLRDVGLGFLPQIELSYDHGHVIRRKDLIDLFDTTPDLAGNDLDIDRFVREIDSSDVQVFWRAYDATPNETHDQHAEPAPRRDELCPVPIGEFRRFAADRERRGMVWRWSFLDKSGSRPAPTRSRRDRFSSSTPTRADTRGDGDGQRIQMTGRLSTSGIGRTGVRLIPATMMCSRA
jgi:CRISPR-associated endonuclease/helicase Cas3